MKILIIQLARLGDIYMTWPLMRALRRMHPAAQIDTLTRPKFKDALVGLDFITQQWQMPTIEILEPIALSQNTQKAKACCDNFIQKLYEQKYDLIINATFSPLSSYIAHALSHEHTQVKGYTRFSDGYLNASDLCSRYFYAQIGIHRDNRIHLTDFFAELCGVHYQESDWAAPSVDFKQIDLPAKYCVFHLGASENHKSLTSWQWGRVIEQFLIQEKDYSVVLIGASHERGIAETILSCRYSNRIVDCVGQTKIYELFPILSGADMLIGCDSAPMHMAGLTNTPSFNISVETVNFWETGPKADLSYIYQIKSIEALSPIYAARIIIQTLKGRVPSDLITRSGGMVSYTKCEDSQGLFRWNLIKSIYWGEAFPMTDNIDFVNACEQMQEANAFAIEQIERLSIESISKISPLLAQADEIIKSIGKIVPDIEPLTRWFEAEKVSMPPGSLENTILCNLEIHKKLSLFLRPYIFSEIKSGVLHEQI